MHPQSKRSHMKKAVGPFSPSSCTNQLFGWQAAESHPALQSLPMLHYATR